MNILSHIRALRYLGNDREPTKGVEVSESQNGTVYKLQLGANEGAKPAFGQHPGQPVVEYGAKPSTNGGIRS